MGRGGILRDGAIRFHFDWGFGEFNFGIVSGFGNGTFSKRNGTEVSFRPLCNLKVSLNFSGSLPLSSEDIKRKVSFSAIASRFASVVNPSFAASVIPI